MDADTHIAGARTAHNPTFQNVVDKKSAAVTVLRDDPTRPTSVPLVLGKSI